MIELIIVLVVVNIFISTWLVFKQNPNALATKFNDIETRIKEELRINRQDNNEIAKNNREELTNSFQQQNKQQNTFNQQIVREIKESRTELGNSLESFEKKFSDNIEKLNQVLKQGFSEFFQQQLNNNKQASDNIKNIEKSIQEQLKMIREDSNKQLNQMRQTVDEKLQTTLEKRLSESFKQVSDRLEQVHKGLGEMQTIATGVGDLKRVLTNVKARGTLGEYQLESILEQMLSPSQYAKNVATKKGSQANVEFAIKLPGQDDKEVWIPIDAKFPRDVYNRLIDAFERGDKSEIEDSQKVLTRAIESFAKDISDKYIDPPHTTDFAIMFLPVEGIFAEVLRHPDLFDKLQRKYKITVTGPTTLSAFLNSLQMGFRTLAVQKRSSEVWDVLKAVKSEFEKFSGVFEKVQSQLSTASGTLENLRTTRTNVMQRKLKNIDSVATIDVAQEATVLEHDN